MARRRDPSPFGSRREGSSKFENMFWVMNRSGGVSPVDAPNEHKRSVDLFERIRTLRIVRVRLVLEAVLVAGGVLLMSGLVVFLPFLGAMLLMLGFWAGIFDVLVYRRLRRSIAEAWVDITLPPEE